MKTKTKYALGIADWKDQPCSRGWLWGGSLYLHRAPAKSVGILYDSLAEAKKKRNQLLKDDPDMTEPIKIYKITISEVKESRDLRKSNVIHGSHEGFSLYRCNEPFLK